ncbi:MAG TPA: hypothetical protein VFV75_13425 [Candidatus Polarisedimenticolaceae bacterium]|nr:hypothetical protein [Candidatus Polarisedimenticolaceae bacterium]
MDLRAFPGGDLVARGLEDLRAGRRTVEALLVEIGAPRLRACGIEVPDGAGSPERALYALLEEEEPEGAHGRYNALVRRLVSFERALECASR